MHNSTKEYVKWVILKLMEQCGISINDIRTAVNEISIQKYEYPEKLITEIEIGSTTSWYKLLFGSDNK